MAPQMVDEENLMQIPEEMEEQKNEVEDLEQPNAQTDIDMTNELEREQLA